MSAEQPPPERAGADANPGGSPSDWDPDGVDLAKALVARARARRRSGAPKPAGRPSRAWRGSPRTSAGSGWSGPAADDRDPQPVAETVKKLADEHGWEEDLSVHGVVARWDQVVGHEIAMHVTPESYDAGVLTVRAATTAWATQVRLLAAELVRKLNLEIGHGTVTRVEVLGPQSRSWSRGPRSVRGRGPRDTYG